MFLFSLKSLSKNQVCLLQNIMILGSTSSQEDHANQQYQMHDGQFFWPQQSFPFSSSHSVLSPQVDGQTRMNPSQIPQKSSPCQLQFEEFSLQQMLKPVVYTLVQTTQIEESHPVCVTKDKDVKKQVQKPKKPPSYNTVDYIIKHCFKEMVSQCHREEIQTMCQKQHISYERFISYWRPIWVQKRSNHIGVNGFRVLISKACPQVRACRHFISVYLTLEYPSYVFRASMSDKAEYLRCATKLMYISATRETSYWIKKALGQ